MDNLIIEITSTTCGEACWCAREDVCRCSCGGKNHGILRNGNGERPPRTCKIQGFFYKLHSIGGWSESHDIAWQMCKDAPKYKGHYTDYEYTWMPDKKGAPAVYKSASANQLKWPEVVNSGVKNPVLVWVRDDTLDPRRKAE